MIHNQKKIFISGRVSGLDYTTARRLFDEAETFLSERGDIAINPTRYCDPSWDWRKCMRECVKLLSECDGVYMLKGWRMSKGARLEHFIALKLGMSVELEK